jgi:hypothetical protein
MANFTRTQLDAVWISGYQPPDSDFEDLDRKAFQGVNGKVGGVYAPTAPIIVGGLGLKTTGLVQVRGSGVLRLETGATLELEDNDYQDLGTNHPGRVREIYQAMAPVMVVGEDQFAVANIMPSGAVQPLASQIRRSAGTNVPSFIKELRVHSGGKLTKVTLRFKVPTPHASVPQEMPKVRIFRVKHSDGVTSNLSSASADGFVSVTKPGSGPAWHSSGAVQSFEITLDQNHTIDTTTYAYFAHVVEERAGVTEFPHQVEVWEAATIALASYAPNPLTGVLDGVSTSLGTVGLFKDEVEKKYNGVWTSPGGAGAWTRHGSLNTEAHFREGMLFPVRQYTGSSDGKANTGTVWQLFLPPPFVLNVSDINITEPVPKGTIFLGMVLRFESITTTAFQ